MKTFGSLIAAMICLSGAAQAGAIPRPGDFYLISRDRFGEFVGSHKLFTDSSKGLKKVSYCRKPYFVRSKSVAWTQVETRRGNVVQIEYNSGNGWRPICEGPDRQVTLSDIGISLSAEDVLATSEEPAELQNRLARIGSMFKAKDTKATPAGVRAH